MAILNFRKVPESLHKALKLKAVEREVSMEELALRYIEEGLKRDKNKVKKRGK
jgi:hypothetical protein